jgi:hypothetical protein
LKRILIVSLVLTVALVAAMPAVAMITTQYLPTSPDAGRSENASFQTPGKAEYCNSIPGNNCDDDSDGIPNDDDEDDDNDDILDNRDKDDDNDGIPDKKDT